MVFAAVGCATTQSLVKQRFAALHGCAATRVTASAGGGWVATGCGIRAHFVCFDPNRETTFTGAVLDDLVVGDDVCIQEQVDARPERFEVHDPIVVSKAQDGSARLRLRVPLFSAPRGELSLIGAPSWRDPAVALRVALQLDEPLPDSCSARLWIDGAESRVRQRERESATALRLALTSEQLAQLGHANAVALELCGHLVQFDRGARARVRLFAERFATARTRLLPAALAIEHR